MVVEVSVVAPGVIARFSGPYRFLSNFWPAVVEYAGLKFPTVEHAYQAAKCVLPVERAKIAMMPRPHQAKAAGKRLARRKDWDAVKLWIMEELLRQKFSHETLKQALLQTSNYTLIEGNYWGDTFWGVCHGVGENHLGTLLMKIRGELQA